MGMNGLALVRTLRGRLLSGIGANAVGQAISVGTQLLSVPIFLSFWSAERYGVWVLITTIPAYVLLADGGFSAVAMNRMTILGEAGRHRAAVRLLQSLLGFLSLAASVVLVVGGLSVLVVPSQTVDVAISVVIITIAALVHLFTGALDGIFRANGDYAKGTLCLELARLAEWVGMIVGYVIGRSYLSSAFGTLVGRLSASSLLVFYCYRNYPKYQWRPRFAKADLAYLLGLRKSAMAWFSMKLSDSVSLQGLTLLVGAYFGATAVAQFSAFRTMSRMVVQGVSALSNSLWPEYSRAIARKNSARLKALVVSSVAATVAAAVAAAVLIYALSAPFIQVWTKGKIRYDETLLILLLAYAVCAASWYTCRIFLVAASDLAKASVVYIGVTGLAFVSCFFGTSFSSYVVPGAMVLSELTMFVVSLGLAWKVLSK